MTINEMIQKRAKVWETAKNFVDTHENENGVLSAEDNATYSRMEQEIEDLTAAIDRQQRAEAMEAELNKPVNMPLTGRPAMKDPEEKTGRASNAYKEDFGAHLRGKGPVHNVLSEGVQIGEMDLLTIGTINDMYTEMQRDEEPHDQLASQDDMDRF